VEQVRERQQRLRIEVEEDRAEPVRGLLHRPHRFLVLAGEGLDLAAVLAHLGQRSMPVRVGPQDVGQHPSVIGVGLLSGLAVSVTVTRHCQRVDRIDGEAC